MLLCSAVTILFWFIPELLLTERMPKRSVTHSWLCWSIECVHILYALCFVDSLDGLMYVFEFYLHSLPSWSVEHICMLYVNFLIPFFCLEVLRIHMHCIGILLPLFKALKHWASTHIVYKSDWMFVTMVCFCACIIFFTVNIHLLSYNQLLMLHIHCI